ncbi:oxidoreductase [Streptomyces sp. NPDC058373]|uniref:oxidoreductase n=1 Tax=Streptomyces sp. NPDC058373 TaxID=3346465 RepID=UPI003650E976
MLIYDELTTAERALWDSFPGGRWVDLRTGVPEEDDPAAGADWGADRTVRAEVVAALLLGGGTERPGGVASLRLAGARITGRLGLAGGEIRHLLWLKGCRLEQAVSLHAAATRTVRITASRLPGVDAGLARVEGHLDLTGSVVETGRLSLINAQVTGELLLNGVRISAAGRWAVFAGGLAMGGGVYCREGFTTRGGVRLVGAHLPGGLFLQGARLESPHGEALVADGATASVMNMSDGFRATGTLRLRGARIPDLLTLDGATLDGGGTALSGVGMQVGTFDFGLAAKPAGAVDLQDATVTALHDRGRNWPDEVRLDGFVYGSLRSEGAPRREDVAHRLAWLRRNPGYAPQPYEQLAACYRQAGHDDDARRVLLAKQRHRRTTLNAPGRVWGRLLDAAVGYGYRPWLAALWTIALCLLGSLVFSTRAPVQTKDGEGAPFNALVYTADLLFPVGDFGQRSAWHWTDATQWLAYLLIAVGWLLTTTVVAGVSRTLNRN